MLLEKEKNFWENKKGQRLICSMRDRGQEGKDFFFPKICKLWKGTFDQIMYAFSTAVQQINPKLSGLT